MAGIAQCRLTSEVPGVHRNNFFRGEIEGDTTYPPKTVPVWRFLTTGERPLRWTFDLIDATTPTPTFRWDDPVAITSDPGFADDQ